MIKTYISRFVQIISGLYCLTFLTHTDSYYIVYLMIGIFGCLCMYCNWKEGGVPDKREKYLTFAFSFIFSMAVFAANYSCFYYPDYPRTILIYIIYMGGICVCFFLGAFSIFWNILVFVAVRLRSFDWEKKECSVKMWKVFLIPFVLISSINLLLLYCCNYPGILSNDSFSQIGQILDGEYTNHHPFYHTMVIKIFITAGLRIFHNINAAVALYHVFQIFFMAGCFSFVAVTLYQMKISLKWIILCMLWYLLMPFHIMYSFTMWKDVMFGGTVLVFLLAAFRILRNIGNKKWINILLLILGSTGMCLFRSNGWFAYFLTVICFFILFWKTKRNLCAVLLGVLVITFILKNPVLNLLHVASADTIEPLAIPQQQIARVICDGGKITGEQRQMLEQIVDIEKIPSVYTPYISDPVKKLIRASGDQEYIAEHKEEMFRLYVDLGLSNPKEYIKAWIDQTRGYWNGGYKYWHWGKEVGDNTLGIYETKNMPWMFLLLKGYLWIFENVDILRIFLCIGLYSWIMTGILYMALIRQDRVAMFLSIPNLAVILSLLVATPVFAEFRYIYSVLCCIPFLIFMAFYGSDEV